MSTKMACNRNFDFVFNSAQSWFIQDIHTICLETFLSVSRCCIKKEQNSSVWM